MNVPSQTLYVGNLNHKTKKNGAQQPNFASSRPPTRTDRVWTRV